jgi:hypothetical protein
MKSLLKVKVKVNVKTRIPAIGIQPANLIPPGADQRLGLPDVTTC